MIAGRSTHLIEFRDDTVVKRYRSWDRGEHEREWNALTLLTKYTSDLVPEPIESFLNSVPPSVVMSRLDGDAFCRTGRTKPRVAALAESVGVLHAAVPAEVLDELPARLPPPEGLAAHLRRADLRFDGSDSVVSKALAEASAWLAGNSIGTALRAEVPSVFGLADGNLANYLWDGERVRMVDFENSGRSDRAFELADIVEHVSAWVDYRLDVEDFLARFTLTAAEVRRLVEMRRLFALEWLRMLLPGGPAVSRNPPETLRRQAERLLALL